MDKKQLIDWIMEHCAREDWGIVTPEAAIRPDLAGLKLFQPPLVGFGSGEDILFEEYKKEGIIGPWHMSPSEWLPGGKSVISLFFPLSEAVRASSRPKCEETAPEWLHGRIEGQAFIVELLKELKTWLEGQGITVCIPVLDQRFRTVMGGKGMDGFDGLDENTFGCNWSERHAAYVCGLGTFGLSKGLITRQGMAGRLGSLIIDRELEADVRPYSEIYEYCSFCGACVHRCPMGSISLEKGKDHRLCNQRIQKTKELYAPRYGCSQCQTAVPCERGIPGR